MASESAAAAPAPLASHGSAAAPLGGPSGGSPRGVTRTWSLRTVLVTSLLAFSVLPAATVGWFLYRSNLQTVATLSEQIVGDLAKRVQTGTEEHIAQAHVVMNGLSHEQAGASGLLRARQLIQRPALFEQNAFAMSVMTPSVPAMYMGNDRGGFVAVQADTQMPGNPIRVGVREPGGEGRRYYAAESPGDRSHPLAAETDNYEPRNRIWYQRALESKGRTFTPVYPSQAQRQLMLTLSQPVYGVDGGALGVFAVDLHLQRLSEMLKTMNASARSTAFVVDENGLLVGTSTGDPLYVGSGNDLTRRSPGQSRNDIVRAAFNEARPDFGKMLPDSVQRVSFMRRIPLAGDSVVMVLRPFGESLGLRWSLVVAAPESDFSAITEAALRKTLAIMGLMLVLGALLAAWLAWGLTRRFKGMRLAAAQLARAEVPPVQADARIAEVRELSQAMHDSAEEIVRNRAAIEAQTAALKDANETLEERVASRTAELAASREEALGAARAKAAFLATMSHEIRTPLNGVVGMTTLLADTSLDLEQRDYVHTMRISSDQLLGVINDILDFSKIESGKLDLEAEPLNLLAAIEEACDIGAPRAREKGLELLVDIGDDLPPWVRGDVTRLRQVLLNFVNNAVKFTEKGQVIVSAHMRDEFTDGQGALIEFSVKDTGIGIPEERHSALFQSFTQVDASTTRKYGGTGLGLAICKRLAELMGGEVGLHSAPGEGSTFWFTARLGPADAPDVAQVSSLHMVSLHGKRAAVVDDTPVNLRILDKQLRRWGMVPVLFERAAEALAWLRSDPANKVDVIVSDMHMPEMDGQTFAQQLRTLCPTCPIVLLTSGTMPTGEEARVFDARLLKPYRQSQLFEAIARVTSVTEAVKPQAKAAPMELRNQFILVADDNAVNLKVALAMLAKLGYEAATALNGREAADRVHASLRTGTGQTPRLYAAILMDANMPVMDGFASSREIISTHGAMAPPIIALTASVLEEDRQRCADAGMIGFLPKPLRIDELSEALARFARHPGEEPVLILEPPPAAVEGVAASDEPPKVLMDWSRLEQFKEFDDEERTMTREVITLFVSDAPNRLQDIRAALAACDSAALSRAAHALKGAASNVGAEALGQACFVMEQSCLQGQWPGDAAQQVALVADLEDKTRQALQEWAG